MRKSRLLFILLLIFIPEYTYLMARTTDIYSSDNTQSSTDYDIIERMRSRRKLIRWGQFFMVPASIMMIDGFLVTNAAYRIERNDYRAYQRDLKFSVYYPLVRQNPGYTADDFFINWAVRAEYSADKRELVRLRNLAALQLGGGALFGLISSLFYNIADHKLPFKQSINDSPDNPAFRFNDHLRMDLSYSLDSKGNGGANIKFQFSF